MLADAIGVTNASGESLLLLSVLFLWIFPVQSEVRSIERLCFDWSGCQAYFLGVCFIWYLFECIFPRVRRHAVVGKRERLGEWSRLLLLDAKVDWHGRATNMDGK